jgi:hypothetical protein
MGAMHRHYDGKGEAVEFESYESIEKRFGSGAGEYLEGDRTGAAHKTTEHGD